jgi:alanyl-tRNA synthetase
VLGPEVHQKGSDITAERTRFDFSFSRKLTSEEIKKVEDLVNAKIKEDLPMQKIVLPKSEAEKTGALYFFKEKYPDPVNVYFVGNTIEGAWSKEFCGGPHVTHTGEIGQFKILKEEAVSAGARRIRATVL